jgi:hypothetical protein
MLYCATIRYLNSGISKHASLELRRKVKAKYINLHGQYKYECQAMGTNGITQRACTDLLVITLNGSPSNSYTFSIKSHCTRAKYRFCNLVKEGTISSRVP